MTRPFVVALALLLPAAAAHAQYGPPARDLRDAVKMLQDTQRLIEPAISAVRDDTAVLNALSRELEGSIATARRILKDTRSLMNVTMAREKLHHDVVHPLQRQVIRNADQLQQLSQQLAFMSQRMMSQTMPEALNAAAYASTDER